MVHIDRNNPVPPRRNQRRVAASERGSGARNRTARSRDEEQQRSGQGAGKQSRSDPGQTNAPQSAAMPARDRRRTRRDRRRQSRPVLLDLRQGRDRRHQLDLKA